MEMHALRALSRRPSSFTPHLHTYALPAVLTAATCTCSHLAQMVPGCLMHPMHKYRQSILAKLTHAWHDAESVLLGLKTDDTHNRYLVELYERHMQASAQPPPLGVHRKAMHT